MAIQRVGVVGCGLMGSGIVQVAAQAGFEVRVREVSADALAKGLGRIDKFLQGGVDKGKLTAEQMAAVKGRIHGTTKLEDLKDSDLVIEAAIESLEAKREVFGALDAVAAPGAIFASNTSSLSITELAARTKRPARFVGLHFFNPVPLMPLVELVRTPMTDEAVFADVKAFAEKLPKVVVTAQDTPGFVVNRLLVPYLLDAIRVLESGIATREDIDNGMKLGCGHPMGPLTLLDFVGLDTTYYIANIMFDEFKEPRFAPPPLLKRMVLAGWNGKKSGRGFYEYAPAPAKSAATT
jgi:3-hydroxybutyryl-CoA dehydrogenase